jgi:hypothetical protein
VKDRKRALVAREEAFDEENVKMHVEVQRAAKALHESDRTRATLARSVGATHEPFDLAEEDAIDRGDDGGILRGERTKIEGQGEYPLADRQVRKDAVDDVRAGVGHDAAGTRWTDAALLAGEGDDAVVAAKAEEAVLGYPALQVGLERVTHVAGEWTFATSTATASGGPPAAAAETPQA